MFFLDSITINRLIILVYRPFTDMIYTKREEERAKAKAGKTQ